MLRLAACEALLRHSFLQTALTPEAGDEILGEGLALADRLASPEAKVRMLVASANAQLGVGEIDLRIVTFSSVLGRLTILGAPFRYLGFQERQLIQIVFFAEVIGKNGVVVVPTFARFCMGWFSFRQVQGFLFVWSRSWQVILSAMHCCRFGSFVL